MLNEYTTNTSVAKVNTLGDCQFTPVTMLHERIPVVYIQYIHVHHVHEIQRTRVLLYVGIHCHTYTDIHGTYIYVLYSWPHICNHGNTVAALHHVHLSSIHYC